MEIDNDDRLSRGASVEQVELSSGTILTIWWAWAWRAVVVGMLVGALLGAAGGFVVGVAGSPKLGGPVGMLCGWLGSIPVSIWAMKSALSKKYSDFSVVLIKRS